MTLRVVIAMLILLGAVIASAIGVVYSIQQSRELFVELTRLGMVSPNPAETVVVRR